MIKIYSKLDLNKLLHIINRFEEIAERKDISPEEQFLQMSSMKLSAGKSFKPHKHIIKSVLTTENITQESWVVIQGAVKITLYDLDDTVIATEIIKKGDSSITFAGGHGYEILEDDTVIYEYKTGPYLGQHMDKTFL
jgi:hypothetical protein